MAKWVCEKERFLHASCFMLHGREFRSCAGPPAECLASYDVGWWGACEWDVSHLPEVSHLSLFLLSYSLPARV